MILWLTGQPGSGKTTLANAFIKKVSKESPDIKIINLDGDDLRNINKNKDYSKEGRIKNISTAISIMRFLANKDYISCNKFTYADIQMVTSLQFLVRLNKIDISDYPNLDSYISSIAARPSFSA